MTRQAVTCMLLTLAGACHANVNTATVGVSATLVKSCVAGTTSGGNTTFGTFNFGTVYFLNTAIMVVGQANAGALQINCNNGTSYTVLLSGGQSGNTAARYLQSAAGARVNYNLYTSASYATIWDNVTGVTQTATGQSVWLPVYGMIPVQATPATGTYTDTVQVTINW
ncbi:spore coat protein U domain-containing protein [Serratia sp. Lou2A]|uniref:Spore coat protein U domain-containing protein n=1 Tax=Serratia montpellierensis TaxID=2598730 RepID=A0ABS8J7Z2_9GAMM|nr:MULTISPECIES: spore coat U domain-containing protein [unclassified Serratia (in: enterobacteria)]MBH3199894.1 spore coat protein U domain-containing protein [Serratia marcescens]MBI6122854.1 spore coat protein U domain-containing protein [Serratia marcescens]MCC7586429.1 spore coat protein U domain-containing protein [Serratia sp. Lou2A]MCC7660132.1 spore coat protein U domain-containing protein [Serratia sp. Pon4B]HEJ6930391.1 spore coat protein U domain-containing protein [Serratia marces